MISATVLPRTIIPTEVLRIVYTIQEWGHESEWSGVSLIVTEVSIYVQYYNESIASFCFCPFHSLKTLSNSTVFSELLAESVSCLSTFSLPLSLVLFQHSFPVLESLISFCRSLFEMSIQLLPFVFPFLFLLSKLCLLTIVKPVVESADDKRLAPHDKGRAV